MPRRCSICRKEGHDKRTCLKKSFGNTYSSLRNYVNHRTFYSHIKEKKTKKKQGRRQKADCQYTELLMCIWLLQIPEITYNKETILNNKQKILDHTKFKYNPSTIEEYFKHFETNATDKKIKKYMLNIKIDLIDLIFKYIYLTGKNCTFGVITKLMKDNHLNSRQKKGDIYIEYDNGPFTSISVKTDSKCPLGNYSTEKFASECYLKHIVNKIKQARISISKEFIPNYDTLDVDQRKKKYKGEKIPGTQDKWKGREKVNTSLYDSKLPIWKLQEQIINNPEVQQKLKESLAPNVTFTNIEYNGDSWRTIPCYTNDTDFKIERCKLLDTNDSAKIWYIISIDNKLTYKADIRVKSGYLFSGSLQIVPTYLLESDHLKLKHL
tara:strand:+ start:693 stop:1832 length:1140 start_codon:yes stop_codon:yes gene_type:complete